MVRRHQQFYFLLIVGGKRSTWPTAPPVCAGIPSALAVAAASAKPRGNYFARETPAGARNPPNGPLLPAASLRRALLPQCRDIKPAGNARGSSCQQISAYILELLAIKPMDLESGTRPWRAARAREERGPSPRHRGLGRPV
jgi:hypothetical protein